jgi:hypothetical protein
MSGGVKFDSVAHEFFYRSAFGSYSYGSGAIRHDHA